MAIWHPDLPSKPGPRARALAEAIGEDIASGLLKPGDRLPPQRDLAYALGLSPNTVMRAYAEAANRGYVGGEVGRGTYVRQPPDPTAVTGSGALTRPGSGGPVDFSRNLPFVGEADAALTEALAALTRGRDLAGYLDRQGVEAENAHREAGAAWIGKLGRVADPNGIVLANGGQQGIFAALLALVRCGDVLLTGALTYAPVKAMARHLGIRIVAVPSDEDGLCPDAVESACRKWRPKALYCTPTLDTPTTVTMGEDRRRRLARIAAAHDLAIVEDDVFGLLPPDRPPPLAVFAPRRTVLVASVSKSVAPGLRIGYVHAPERMASAIRTGVGLSSWMPPPLMAEIVRRWIGDGTAARLNGAQRAHAARRQAMARAILPGHDFTANPHGPHLWLALPEPWSGDTFAAAAERAGVLLQPAGAFAVAGTSAPAAVRLCLSHETSDRRVEHGLSTVAALLNESTEGDLVL